MKCITRLIPTKPSIVQWKFLSTIVKEQLTVQTFCDVNVNVPYHVNIKPLDVHQYHNCDLLKIELTGPGRNTMKHVQDGNNIKIFATTQNFEKDVTCTIQAPVKATQGDIYAGTFSGTKIALKSTKGNIFVDKFQGETIDLHTINGDIVLKNAIVAANINVIVKNKGSIKTKRLQGLNSLIKTKQGDITVDSSYCDNGCFECESGFLNLKNLHKSSKIKLNEGSLNLTGLDGQLDCQLERASAEIQISRILGDSKIIKSEDGELKLSLSEDCQDNTMFEVNSKSYRVDSRINLIPSESNVLYLTPLNEKYLFKVECEKGHVRIDSLAWINTLKLNLKK